MTDTGGQSSRADLPQAGPVPGGVTPAGDAVHNSCPFLVAAGGGWRGTYPTRDHRCAAIDPPVAIALVKQRDLCLRRAHSTCATFQAATELEATAVAPIPAGDAGLWPATRGPLVALEPARGGAPQLPGGRGRSAQAFLVGVMVLAFAILVVARTAPPQAGTGASAPPGSQGAPSGPATPTSSPPGSASASPSASASRSPATPLPSASGSPVATPVPSARPSPPPTIYTVTRGDTLTSIAAANGTSVKALKKANGLTSSLIRVGQELVIP